MAAWLGKRKVRDARANKLADGRADKLPADRLKAASPHEQRAGPTEQEQSVDSIAQGFLGAAQAMSPVQSEVTAGPRVRRDSEPELSCVTIVTDDDYRSSWRPCPAFDEVTSKT